MTQQSDRKQYKEISSADHLPDQLSLGRYCFETSDRPLRYGLAPGDAARSYKEVGYTGPSVLNTEVIQEGSKIRSYGNIEDWDTGLSVIQLMSQIYPKNQFVCVMKHAIPFAVARGSSLEEAYSLAWGRDPIIPFGGVIVLSGIVEEQLAERLHQTFIDGILAKGYSKKAIDVLTTKPDLRVLCLSNLGEVANDFGCEVKSINGGILVAERHKLQTHRMSDITVTSQNQPDERMLRAAIFQWMVCSFVRSNAASFGDDRVTYGVGAGQGSRIDAITIALSIAGKRCPYYQEWKSIRQYPLVLATDGFPPEIDSVETCHEYGMSALMSPRGSIKDQIVLDRANQLGLVTLSPVSNERPFTHR
ncbi:MAG: hypothetical protein SVY53_13300 [Chloroflexota bacterium]|nr:hypothetical protein [Chloroflexota bacterium]